MYGGYGGKNADSPSERGGRFGGGGLGSPSKSASKSSNKEASRSVNAARSDTPSSGRAKGGLGTASKASNDTASKAATGSSTGSLAGRTRMGSVERASTPKAADRTPATGFSLQGRTRMESVTRPARSPGFENKSSVPARSVPTQSFTPSSPASTVPQSVMDRTGFATSYPTGFDLKGRTRMSSVDRATTVPTTKGLGASVGDMDLAQQRRATENTSMQDMAKFGRTVKSVVEAGKGYTTVELNDGTIERRTGDRASRNNNPGNIEYGEFAKSMGAVGTDGRFATFASKEDGLNAVAGLLGTKGYRDKTIAEAIGRYAPAFENNTAAYAATVARAVGVPASTRLSSLSADQKMAMVRAITGVEGNTGYQTATLQEGRWGAGQPNVATAGTGDDFETRAPEMAGTTVPTPAADQSFPAAPTPPRNVLNLPTRAPKPTARDAPAYKRSGLGTVMAGGLDLLSSMGGIPALVGQGLSFVTTGKSLGENVVDYVSQNENYFQPGEGTDAPGYGDPERLTADFLETRKKIADKKAKAEEPTYDFVEKYIEFENTSGRPTPEQKWDWRSSKYIGVT